MISEKLFLKAENTIKKLKKFDLRVACAESCTGGMVSSYITSVAGVSDVFELGVTSYSCRIKNKILGVDNKTLENFGAVSQNTAREMAENVRQLADSDLGISVTGVAGPDDSEGHPPGYVFIAVSGKEKNFTKLLNIKPVSRNFVRESACEAVFELIEAYIEDVYNEAC